MIACDVLVVGLGPAGGAAARAAARGGARVLAVDRKRDLGLPVQCAEFVPVPLRPYTLAAGVRIQDIEGMTTVLPSGRVERTSFAGIMIDRARFDRALAEGARADGATLMTDTRLAALEPATRMARLRTPQGAQDVRWRVLVAADGPRSAVARMLGLPPLAVLHTRQYTVALGDACADTDIHLSAAYPGGYAWLFPKGRVANLGLGYDERMGGDFKAPLDALHASLAASGRVGREVLGRTGGAIPVSGLRDRLAFDEVLFAGDAAGLTHPITGAGIPAAVASGAMAGEAAVRLVRGDGAAACAGYEEDVRDQFEGTLARALARRAAMAQGWGCAQAHEDAFHRRGWIAFPEYFQ